MGLVIQSKNMERWLLPSQAVIVEKGTKVFWHILCKPFAMLIINI